MGLKLETALSYSLSIMMLRQVTWCGDGWQGVSVCDEGFVLRIWPRLGLRSQSLKICMLVSYVRQAPGLASQRCLGPEVCPRSRCAGLRR
jgi:hypothetical protein